MVFTIYVLRVRRVQAPVAIATDAMGPQMGHVREWEGPRAEVPGVGERVDVDGPRNLVGTHVVITYK